MVLGFALRFLRLIAVVLVVCIIALLVLCVLILGLVVVSIWWVCELRCAVMQGCFDL